MASIFEGQGFGFTKTGITGVVKDVPNIPGWDREVFETTRQANTAVKTFMLSALKKYDNIDLVLEFDIAVYKALALGNSLCVIDYMGTPVVSFWGALKKASDMKIDSGKQITIKLEIQITNLNDSGVETAPY